MSEKTRTNLDSFREFPMTDIQSAYWVGRRADIAMGGVSTHVYEEVHSTDLDPDRLEESWNRIVQRHEMLRSVVSPEGLIRIHDETPYYRIPQDDLRGLTRYEQEIRLRTIRTRHREEVLPSDAWPLWRVRTARLTGKTFRIFLSFDAIPCDARSRSVIYEDWKRLYRDPDADLEPPAARFGDFLEDASAHRESEEYRRSQAFWRERTLDIPPPPLLPPQSTGDSDQRFRRVETTMAPDRWRDCRERCERWGASPTALLTAIFGKVLADWSRDPRFHIVLTIFDRLGRDPRYSNVVGDFTSSLVLPMDCTKDPGIEAMARQVGADLRELLPRSDYSGVRVLRDIAKAGVRFPRRAIPCVLTSTIGSDVISGKEWRTDWMGDRVELRSQTPQVGIDFQIFEVGGELRYNWDYDTNLVSTNSVRDMFRDYREALEHVVSTGRLPAAAEERAETPTSVPRRSESGFLHDGVFDQARRRPDAPAIITDQRTIDYREMSERATWIGTELVRLGVRRDELVGIVMRKGWEQVVAALGTSVSGAAYLPIDATLPAARMHHILERGEVARVLTTSDLVDSLDLPGAVEVIEVDRGGRREVSLEPVADAADPSDLAYVIFTSGSTGEPKGVAMEHRATRNTIDDVNDRLDVRPSDRILAVSSLSFDLSVYDVFGPLSRGGAVVVPSPTQARDPSDWSALVARHEVTLWNSVPTLAQLLFEQLAAHPEAATACRIRSVLMSGDWIPVPLPDQLRSVLPGVEIIGMGGATEAAIWSVIEHLGPVDPDWRSIPYGRAMRNQTIEIRDEDLKPCDANEIGEILIGGVGLARGYWKDDSLTNASFVRDARGLRLYRTGDLGRYDAEGRIEFLGRIDQQVKIRGFRIEIGEVEHAIRSHPIVSECIVKAAGPPCGERRLVAYVVPNEGHASLDLETVRAHVGSLLPEYMIPVNWHRMDALPLAANGKVDRTTDLDALVSEWCPGPDRDGSDARRPPAGRVTVTANESERGTTSEDLDPEDRGDAIRSICRIAEAVLGMRGVDPDSDLIDLGANSVDVIRIANRIETTFDGTRPQLDEIYDHPTPAGIAALLGRASDPRPASPPPITIARAPDEACRILKDPEERAAFRKAWKGRRQDAEDLDRIDLARHPEAGRARDRNARRRSHRLFDQNPVKLERLGRVLECLADAGVESPKFRYGSAGGLYPVQAYLLAMPGRIDGLEEGAYYLDPRDHCLRRIGGIDGYGPDLYDRLVNAPIARASAFAIMLSLHADAIEPMYGDRWLEYGLVEAGLIAQLLETEGPDEGIGFCQIGRMEYGPVHRILRLDARDRLIYSLLGGGIPTGNPPRFFSREEGSL